MRHEPKIVLANYPDGSTREITIQSPIKEKDRVLIVGTASTKDLVPWNLPDAEYWGVNNLYGVQLSNATGSGHYDRWFEIHNLWQDPRTGQLLRRGSPEFRGQSVNDYVKGLAALNCTVYMQKHWPEAIPLSVQYPLEEVVKFFQDRLGLDLQFCRYLTNTISYEIVLAIYLGFTSIEVWGVDMQAGCLTPDTRVLTSDLRWVPSGDLEVGDQVMAFDEEPNWANGERRSWKVATVTANPEIKRPCYRIALEDGSEIVASDKHGWLTHGENHNRWRTTDQLLTRHHRTGRPTRIVKLVEPCNLDNSWESGYIAAAFDGEGNLSQTARTDHYGSYHCSIGFAQRDNPMLETVESILKSYGYDFGVSLPNGGECLHYAIKGGKPEVMRFLSQFRPKRLLPKFNPHALGILQAKNNVAVTGLEFIGEQTVMGLETNAKTYIAEGFASHNSEYGWQRPSCEFWLGVAAGMGIKIHVPAEADLLKSRFLYGFEESQQQQFRDKLEKIRKDMKLKRLEIQNRQAADERAVQQYLGAEQVLNEIQNIWTNLDDDLTLKKRGS